MKLIFKPAKAATLLLFSTILLITACEKENSATVAEEEFASKASSEADAESDDIFNEVFDNVIGVNTDVALGGTGVFGQMNPGTSGGTYRTNACPNVSVIHLNAPSHFPVKIIMDFGTGCTGRDGRTRSGKIISIYTNRLIYPGAKATTTFDGYTVDSIKVQGTQVITNQTETPTNTNCITHKWKVVVENAKLTKPNGNYTEWNSIKTVGQVEGMCTPFTPMDDIYKIIGSANGKVKRGNLLVAWRAETVEPLVKKFSCRWLVKGIIKVARLNLTTNSPWLATVNYGHGDCDNKAVVTINGVSHIITLP
jgi:hypothetical protein